MTDAGYPGLMDPGVAESAAGDLEFRYEEQYGSLVGQSDELEFSSWDSRQSSADREALISQILQLAQFREEEVAAATADFTCRDQVDLGERILAAERLTEQQFIDTHREELDEAIRIFLETWDSDLSAAG
ncbi:MAG: hypothetical protein ACK5KU_11450 [Beutenbergiaceae bacterium]